MDGQEEWHDREVWAWMVGGEVVSGEGQAGRHGGGEAGREWSGHVQVHGTDTGGVGRVEQKTRGRGVKQARSAWTGQWRG
jgi:hypothetical protein